MRVFYFGTQERQAYLYLPSGDFEAFEADPPRSLKTDWVPPTFELVTKDDFGDQLPKCDFPSYLPSTPILSQRAVERLGASIALCGEALPIQLSNDSDSMYMFNVTLVLDAIDMERSKFLRFRSGRIMKYERLVFDPTKVPEEPLFFKTTQLGPVTEVFVTEGAVAAVQSAGLIGYDFRLAWSDD